MTKMFATVLLAVALIAPSLAGAQDAPKAPTTAPDAAGPSKFYGTVTAVDAKAMTFTVDKQVYHVIGETLMTKADDSKATLEDAVVGQPARGTFTKTSDGALNVTKVRFGKKAGGGKANGKGGKNGAKKGAATQPQE
jgi:hypothetical protein